MSFCESLFSFDGISCTEFDLSIYELSDHQINDGFFAGTADILEEHIASKYTPLFYGVKYSKKLEFQIIFGLNEDRLNKGKSLTMQEADAIAAWLIGHDEYKYLVINHDELADIRFKCMVTSLEEITYGKSLWAMRATITCDGPYAYRSPSPISFHIKNSGKVAVNNLSSHNGYYRPVIQFKPTAGGDLVIQNITDNGRVFEIKNIPASVVDLQIDNETLVITNSAGLNLYKGFNKRAFRLKRGNNELQISGSGELIFHCEFPINVCG